VRGGLEGTLQEQAQLLADVEIAAASPEAGVAGSEACRCLRTAATRGPRAPGAGAGGGRFEAVAGGGGGGLVEVACGRGRRLGRIVVRHVAVVAVGLVVLVVSLLSGGLPARLWQRRCRERTVQPSVWCCIGP
jgi:hypothetical protein